jgi:hypothetical protein
LDPCGFANGHAFTLYRADIEKDVGHHFYDGSGSANSSVRSGFRAHPALSHRVVFLEESEDHTPLHS